MGKGRKAFAEKRESIVVAIFRDFRSRNFASCYVGAGLNKRRNRRKTTGRATKRHERKSERKRAEVE